MTIRIEQPALEALIAERMDSGSFVSVEDFLFKTLKSALRNTRDFAGLAVSLKDPWND